MQALRYDASRVVDMKARAQVTGDAIAEALAALDPASTSANKMANAAADAALNAYDAFADREARQRDRTTDGTNEGLRGSTEGEASTRPAESSVHVPVSEGVLQQRPYFQAVATSYVAGLVSCWQRLRHGLSCRAA